MNKYIFLLCISFQFTCSSSYIIPKAADEKDQDEVAYNLLFVGNSLTYTNDLPDLVKNVAKQNDIIINVHLLAKPNYAIIDHWREGKVRTLIQDKEFDFVIIQQGPSSQPDGYNMLVNDGKKYADLCKENNTRLVFFMVWPSRTYYKTFDGVVANYTNAAILNDAILCPVGLVWKKHFDETGDFSYYGPDQFHPSLEGSKVAAKVIFESLKL